MRLHFFCRWGCGFLNSLHHTDRLTERYPSPNDNQLRALVNDACTRIEAELRRRAPSLGELVCDWMAHLSPTGKAPEYFMQARSFPLLNLPWWAAKSFTATPDYEFLADIFYSTV